MDSRSEAKQESGRALKERLPQPDSVARGLGWFSIALGLAELVAPRMMARVAGVETGAGAMRFYGLREVACGVGILASRNPRPFLWARVGGDALDLGTLALSSNKLSARDRQRATVAAVNVACVTALDVYAANCAASARRLPSVDYRDRTGFANSPAEMRGAALSDFETPRDMRTPDALAPYTREQQPAAKVERRRAGSVTGEA
ncbi:hypothetical protein [Paraburkholderia rhynchosiae]|uniref:Cyclase dehydrase n=1 Tax=Paraburkholderia rhynchosiae TaxID=487049 RepID=A0A2N7WT87_9BURK|nr:hypothetical protein [Paraburkholderia rhynchosiae]PMS32607.1 hypothetical protein C0Z16_07375 [Paraburkholderia rhynchosiae]CAB3675938.1 hypothetical protein LMG27174_02388 [Paraburkholderia rhynchosiae]